MKLLKFIFLYFGGEIAYNDVTLLNLITCLITANSQELSGYHPNLIHSGICLTFHCEFQVKPVQCLHGKV